MAKKIYNIPLQKVKEFYKHTRGIQTEFYATYGKLHYTLEIEKFIYSLQLHKDETNAMKITKEFLSSKFINQTAILLELSQKEEQVFYALCYELYLKERELFELFLQKLFTHFHSSYNRSSNITIDHIAISKELAKLKHLKLKDSFGEVDKKSFFKIYVNDTLSIELYGNSIKTLRKKAYKKLTYKLLDFKENNDLQEVYDKLQDMKIAY